MGGRAPEEKETKTTYHDVNSFYQGVSEQHAAHFDRTVAPTLEQTPVVTSAVNMTSLLVQLDGSCVFSEQQQVYCSHFKYALVDHWQQLISEHASLEGKALLLPVRINLAKEDLKSLTEEQSWFTLLGFELVIEKQFVIVKKLPHSLYLLDVNQALESLLQACKNKFENLDDWLKWQCRHVPERYFTSNAFAAELSKMKNNPQTIQRLRSKAVKIDIHHYLTQLD